PSRGFVNTKGTIITKEFLVTAIHRVAEAAALAGAALDLQPAAVGLGYLLHHREAQAGAAVHAAGAVRLPEALPDVGQVLFVYADARVADLQPQPPGLGVQAHADLSALRRILEGVLHQVLHQPRHEADVHIRVDAGL